ncbi:MAG: hypothetical protein WDZ35_13700 [Crocinitomicaceae bacterium]
MRSHFFKVFVCFLFSAQLAFSQGRVDGFLKGEGNIDLVLGGGYEIAGKYYAGTNKIDLGRAIANVNLFIAAGLTDRIDLNLSIPYVMISNTRSIQDGALFLKMKIVEKEMWDGVLSGIMAAGVSTYLANYQTEGFSAIGQQATTIDFRPLLHYQHNTGWFATLQFPYIYKFNPVPTAINPSLKVGRAHANYYFDIWYEHQTSFGGRDYQGTPAPTTFRELGVDFHKLGGTFYLPLFDRLGTFAGVSYVLSGRNIGKGFGLNAGIVLKSK